MSDPPDMGSAVEEIVVLVMAVLVAGGGAWLLLASIGCENACGSSGERTGQAIMAATAGVSGLVATALAARGRLAAAFAAIIFGLVWFVVAVAQAFSHLN